MTTEAAGASDSHIARANVLEPAEWYSELRARCPVFKDENHEPPFYVLSRYSDVDTAIRDTDLWVNRDGPGLAFASQKVLQSVDGDTHRRHRATVTQAFTSPAMRRLEPTVETIINELFDDIQDLGQGDWMELLAKPFPAIVIAEILGVPRESRNEFAAASAEIVAAFGDGDVGRYQAASTILRSQISAVLDERLAAIAEDGSEAELPDDVSTMLALAHLEGTLSYDEAVGIGTNLLIGGHETTANLIALIVYRMAERPELLEQVRVDRTLVDAFVEESLRFDSPTQGMFRTNTRDTEIDGVEIPSGSKLELLFASANRDADVWETPEEFRLDRNPRDLRRHMAFGRGTHLCIGAPLARMEAAVVINQIADRFETITLLAEPGLTPSFILRGFSELNIAWTLR